MTTETKETKFHCSASWHITNGLAFRIYELAYMVAKKSGTFFASALQLAEYFQCSESSIYRALDYLADLGFFVLLERGFFESNTYTVISHKEWQKANPNRCPEKLEYSYSGDGDPLGQDLYALSGGRVKFLPHQMTEIRKAGFSEDEIKDYFTSFLSLIRIEKRKKRKFIPVRFLMFLRHQRDERDVRDATNLSRPIATDGLKGRAKTLREDRIARLALAAQAV